MSRASTELSQTMATLTNAVLNTEVFTKEELKAMLMASLSNMNKNQLESLVAENTRFEDMVDVEVAMM